MAHELEVRNGKASMFYVGETPWHGLGTKIEGRPTSAEAIKAAGLDWEVHQRPVFLADPDPSDPEKLVLGAQAPAQANYRADTGEILGVVGPAWKPLQNAKAFEFFDAFVGAGQAAYETAGALRGGRRVWVLAEILSDPVVVLPGDEVRKYLLLSNSHDGSMAIRVGYTPIRVVCANTLAAAIDKKSSASKLIRIRHHGSVDKALEKIRDVMNVVDRTFQATADQYRALAKAGCDDADLKKYVNLVFAPERVKKAIGLQAAEWVEEELSQEMADAAGELDSNVYPKVRELFEAGRGVEVKGVRGTLWGAYNAISEYIVHERGKDAATRLDSAWFGQGFAQNQKALKVGVQLAKEDA